MAEDYVAVVNDVISSCRDAEQGFRGAADAVKDPTLKMLFERFSAQRAEFARELQLEVERTGRRPDDPAGVGGAIHRGWIELKGVLTGHSEHQILIEAERGEDSAVKTYREALAASLPAEIQTLLQRQFSEVKKAHDEMKMLRDKAAHEPATAR